MIFRNTAIVFALALSSLCASAQDIQKLPTTSLSIGMHIINAEVASSEAEHEQGLMQRKSLAPNEGMLFVFERPATVCMWMKDTLIPLAVAFIDADGKIVNIEEMKALSLDSHCGKKPLHILYALEMNQGWFKHKNIKPGAVIDGLPAVHK